MCVRVCSTNEGKLKHVLRPHFIPLLTNGRAARHPHQFLDKCPVSAQKETDDASRTQLSHKTHRKNSENEYPNFLVLIP